MFARSLLVSCSLLAFASSAVAQGTCTPKDTPDPASAAMSPTLFPHCLGEDKCGAVDKNGAWRVQPTFLDVLVDEDFVVVPENEDWTKFGFLDKDGKRLGGGDYSIAVEDSLPSSEGFLAVTVNEKTGFVDRTGTLVIPAEYGFVWGFQDGLSAAEKDGQGVYIDKTGKTVITMPAGFDDLGGFADGIAVVGKDGKYGLIDRTGKIVVEPQFPSLHIDNGVLIAMQDDLTGIVDREGKWIVEPQFDFIGGFSQGLAPAQKGEKWGFIDTCGTWKVEPKYDYTVGFEGGPARVRVGEKWGLIDKDGMEIMPPEASYIGEEYWTEGLVPFSPDGTKYGLLDKTGKVAIQPKYDSVNVMGGGVLLAYEGEEETLLGTDGAEIKIAAP